MKKESEKLLERKLSVAVQKLGGISIKLVATYLVGLPDRLCLLPEGRMFFAEIKTTGEKPRKIQTIVHNKLRALGFLVVVIDSTEALNQLIKDYEPKQFKKG